MNEFTKERIQGLRASIDTALDEVAKKHGLISLKAGNASFRPTVVTFKLEGRCGDGKADPAVVAILEVMGFKPSILEADLSYKGKTYRVIEPRRRKILLSCDDGKEYTMGIDMLKLLAKDHLK